MTDRLILLYLQKHENPRYVLIALVLLEKFAASPENKIVIVNKFNKEPVHPLLVLERRYEDENLEWHQVGFAAKWSLDNVCTLILLFVIVYF